jgi:glycosyltransferase involved in cell wall biosynthesis
MPYKPVKEYHVAVCQLTSAHLLEDERILHRMAWSLRRAGFESAVAGPNGHNDIYESIRLIVVAGERLKPGRLQRLKRLIQLLHISALYHFRIFQFHDPDLLLIAPIFKLFGKRVVYDVHDDYEASILVRLYDKPLLRWLVSKLWWLFEHNISRVFDGIVVADRHLAAKFEKLNPVILGNFPRLNFTPVADTSVETTFNLIYVGGVDRERGIDKALDALELLPYEDIRFHVVGECKEKMLLERLKTSSRVVCHGRVAWTDLHKYYTRAHVGVALYQPIPSFLYCPGENSVKIIEYMAAGIPVICSDFPGLKTFVEDAGYGLTVQPNNPAAISEKIQFLYERPKAVARMGQNGRHAFETEYNWEKHEGKLITLYEKILRKKTPKSLAGKNKWPFPT